MKIINQLNKKNTIEKNEMKKLINIIGLRTVQLFLISFNFCSIYLLITFLSL